MGFHSHWRARCDPDCNLQGPNSRTCWIRTGNVSSVKPKMKKENLKLCGIALREPSYQPALLLWRRLPRTWSCCCSSHNEKCLVAWDMQIFLQQALIPTMVKQRIHPRPPSSPLQSHPRENLWEHNYGTSQDIHVSYLACSARYQRWTEILELVSIFQ